MLVIKKNKLEELAFELAKREAVVCPVLTKKNETSFEKIKTGDELDLHYEYSVLPAKKLFFPPKEKTFVFDNKRKKATAQKSGEKFVLFALNLRDTEALVQLDEMMDNPHPDYFYFEKREKAIIVSLVEEEGTKPHKGVDLILEKITKSDYRAIPITKEGKRIARHKLFVNTKDKAPGKKVMEENKVMPELRQKLLLDAELLSDAVKWSWENKSELWDELGKKCLSCGICTYVCPLCYCFSIEDSCSLDEKTCTKTRKWCACTLPEFAEVTGGHNFHRSLKERYYNWFYHKFVRAYKEYGKSQCVACGRCKQYCPAGIDIEKILIEIVEDYQKTTKQPK